MGYIPPRTNDWKGRSSAAGLYFHENINFLDLDNEGSWDVKPGDFVILGFCCDEGVRRNSGRPGASDGPRAIKQHLSRLAYKAGSARVFDGGMVVCKEDRLEESQEALGRRVKQLIDLKTKPILLGGGHEIAYGHYKGLAHLVPSIVNLDAHFDLRKPEPLANSGTPFFQIAQDNQQVHADFHYLVLGIRPDANSSELYETARMLGVQFAENIPNEIPNPSGYLTMIDRFAKKAKGIYLTIDLDVFSSAFAPGVSAASPFGFTPEFGLHLIREVLKSGKVCSVDIAEMNPTFDLDDRTAKLAAGIITQVMRNWDYSNQDL